MRVDVIIPTFRPGKELGALLDALLHQTVTPGKIFIMNTEDEESGRIQFNQAYQISNQIEITHLPQCEFDHAATRNRGAEKSDADYLLFCTQDAIPSNNLLIEQLLGAQRERVVLSYARQIADETHPIEFLSRKFNYPEESSIKNKESKKRFGIKTIFNSNVCALYNRKVFNELIGFDNHNIFNEDMLFAHKVIEQGYSIAYVAEATIHHSHNYGCAKIFHRFFDQGVSQKMNETIFKEYSSLNEGGKQAEYILKKLWGNGEYKEIIRFFIQSCAKVAGYLLGKNYRILPLSWCRKLSMNKSFFR